jgi:uncharacterized membrane protein YkvA (DUF1232 family)
MFTVIKDFVIQIILLIYIVSPIDFIPDIMPVLGWIDDIGATIIFFVKLNKYIKIVKIIKILLKVILPIGLLLGLIALLIKIF